MNEAAQFYGTIADAVAGLALVASFWQTAPTRLRIAGAFAGALCALSGAVQGDPGLTGTGLLIASVNVFRWQQLERITRRVRRTNELDLSIDWLRPFMVERKCRAGEMLFFKNDAADGMFYIESGIVRLPEIDVQVGHGQLFGEIALFSPDKRRTLTAQCATDATLLYISERDLLRLYFEKPEFGLYLIQLITKRLTQDLTTFETSAVTDALTGVPNRRGFDEALYLTWQRALTVTPPRPVALLVLDIDYFKRYNDSYGHAAGDACLQFVARALRDGTPPNALLARYGGEEFAAVVYDVDEAEALAIGERMRANVYNASMLHAGSPFGRVTISIGIASQTPSDPHGAQRLFEAADRALYEAKATTRNRVVVGTMPFASDVPTTQ